MISLIYGSGFGLYGYLPAIYKFSTKIYLNKKYELFFNSRNELAKFESKIIWYTNINKIIQKIDYLIIAKRPQDQSRVINSFLNKRNKIKHFFLEKPIACTPKKSSNLLKKIYLKKINYSVGFLFEYTSWFKLIKNQIKNKKNNNILIKWNIIKNDAKNSWKYNHKIGGGLIRYYGVHFIKLFSDLNFTVIKKNIINKNYWVLDIEDKKKNIIKLLIRYSKISKFSYKINDEGLNKLNTPFFNKIDYKLIDPRCFFLEKYIRKNLSNYKNDRLNMKKFFDLWHGIESKIKKIN